MIAQVTPAEKKYQFTKDFFSSRIPVFKKLFEPYVGMPNVRLLEIGSLEGRSACWFLDNVITHHSSLLYCIDIFYDGKEYEKLFDKNILLTGKAANVIKLKGWAQTLLKTLENNSFDAIYIDGGHDSKSVMYNMLLSWDLLKVGGILVMDDYLWKNKHFPGEEIKTPKPAIDSFLNIFAGSYELLEKKYVVAVRKTEQDIHLRVRNQ